MSTDTLTILRSRGRRLAKLIRAGGDVQGYDSARTYDMHSVSFDGLEGLRDHLAALAHRPEHCVVRGAILDPNYTKGVRRLVHPDKETGERPTLVDAPCRLVALDCDGIPAPEGMDRRDLDACGILARLTMPAAFHNVACIVQATAGHAIKPGLRLRLWFLLERALTGADCQRWLRGVPGVDPSTLRAAQVTYTAAPLFVDMADPLPRRLAMLPGLDAVACPTEAELQPPPRPAASPSRAVSAETSDRYVRAALMRACSNIATAAEGARHPTAVAEAWGLARFVVAGTMTADEVIRAVDGALEQAGKPKGEGAKIAAWAVSQRTDAGNLPIGGRG
ncbi:hypothetical protein J8J14_18175 [Roseomonas sp. SSH11]|uniref:Uncharacterized protein n=1 Tax=Pararoseomonas baculiformis TaxID=2820812 RepID=A0ABS4AI54_9PROT|nr:hypothetical protein [Pararoseomonas baculiformis]MBP0446707.1 hypothetical protein [Pararoseomonas baculiformis]